ncbi:2-isopropylmalate synthase [uncultured archaeon]|nr:2-isopropylmalate synthase [uncultured archaeon]
MEPSYSNKLDERKRVFVFDTTLRDGEQAAGVSLNPKQKLKIALQLERLGVDVIEGGFPASNEEDFRALEMISKNLTGPAICAFGRATKGDIEECAKALENAKKKRIHLFLATSKLHLDAKLKKTEEQALEMIYNGVSYARTFVDEIEFTPEDGSRTDLDYLFKVVRTAYDAGARIINIADTVGYCQPSEMYERVKKVRKKFSEEINSGKMSLSVHCHNDMGQAVSNSLQGILAGATQFEGTILGMGERTGNASLEEVIAALETRGDFYQTYTNIQTEEIYRTAKLVSKLTGIEIPINKPLLGKNASRHESGIHQHGVLANPKTYEVVDPKSVGWEGERFCIGKHSGKHIKEYLRAQRRGVFGQLKNYFFGKAIVTEGL